MADLKFSKVKLSLDGKQVELSLDQIRKKAEQTATAMKGMKPDSAEWKQARKNLEALHAAEEDLIPTLERVNHYMKEMAHTATTDLGKATRELTKLRDAMPGDHKDLDKVNGFIEVFKEWMKQNRNLGVTFEKAKEQLNDFVNTPTEKLKQGLKAIQDEMGRTKSETARLTMGGMAKKYEAEIAVRENGRAGGFGTWNYNTIATETLQKERQRLMAGFNATDGVAGYEAINKEYLDKLHKVNQLLSERAEKERQLAQEQRKEKEEIDKWNSAVEVWKRLAAGQAVSLQELTDAYKALDAELKKVQGVDSNQATNIKNGMEQIKAAIEAIEGKQIDISKIISDPNATLEQMEAALKKLKEEAAQVPAGFDWDIRSDAEDIETLEQKISDLKAKMQGIADLDFDFLEDVPTEKLEAALKRLEEQEKKLKGTDEDMARQMAENKRKVLAQIQRNKQAVLDVANAEKVAGETGKHSVQELQQAYDVLKQKLMGLSTGNKVEIERTQQQMKKLKGAIDEVTGSVAKQNSVWKSAVRNITAYVGVFGMFNFVKNKISEVIRGGEELSDQMAQVRMVSGLAMEDIEDLTRTLAKMDTRTTLSELERIAYAGAKLGFGEYGTKGLEEFVRAANQVNVALREDLGEEALTALSKITENMGLIKKMGVEDAMLATSSAMFKLAATSTAAAGPIVEVTKRLVPVAQASGMATHEILALASASDSLQLMPEVVGTALSKLLMAMQNNHNLIEQTLGIDEGTIARMIKAGDVMDAMLMIFDKMSGKNMTELSGIWKLLGSDGQRLITVVQAMANHTDTLRKHLETSTQAFKEATAVTEEYNIQQETAAALMQRASNLWRNAMVNADTSLSVKEMAKSWYDFSKSVLDSEFSLGAIKVTIDALLGSIRLLINLLPMIAFGLMAKGAAMLTMKLLSAKMSVDSFTLSWKKMDAATKSNWIGLAIGLFAQLAFSIAQWAKSNEEAEASQRKLNQALDSAADKAEQEINAMSRLKAQVEDTSLSQEERMKMFSKFKTDYDIYLNYLGIELKSVDELAKHYDALTKVMRQRFAYQEREDYKRDVMGGEDGLRMKRRSAGAKLVKSGTDAGVNIDLGTIDTLIGAGKSAAEIRRALFPQTEDKTPVGAYANPNAATLRNPARNRKNDAIWDALVKYVSARVTETTKEQDIDAAFAQEIGDFDYDKWLRTQVKGDFKLKPDKDAIAAAKKAAQERKQALRKEMEDAQKASTGIISKLEEYYRLQEAAINEARADGQMTEEHAKEMVRSLNILKNESLATARRAVTTGDTKEWDELKTKVLPSVLADTSDVSQNLLSTIQQVAVDKLHNDLQKFNGGKDVMGLDSRAFFDQMNAKAAGNQREAARLRAKIQNEIEKALLQYQFVEKANQQMRKDLEAIGITTGTYEQWAKRMQQGITEKPATVTSSGRSITDKEAYREMGNKFVDMGVINFRYNIENQQEAEQWLNDFATTSAGELEDWAQAFPKLVEWINLIKRKEHGETLGDAERQALEDAMPAIRNLFDEMMRHADRLDKAMKDAFQHEKETQESRFRVSGYKDEETKINKYYVSKAKQEQTGAGQTFAQQLGLGSIANDPEILQIQNRIYWRNKEVEDARARLDEMKAMQQERIDMLRENGATEEEIHALEMQNKQDRAGLEQLLMDRQAALTEQTTALTTKTMQELQKRVTAVQNLTKPFSDAAKNIGQKFGEMIRGAEEDSMTWEEIWHNMLIAVGESVIQMGAQYAQNLIMQQAMNRASEAETAAHTTAEVTAGIAAGSAKTIGTLGWWGIPLIAVISALLMGLLQGALSTNRGSKSSETSTKAAAPKTKLVSGMLTYDRGNVDKFAGRRKLYDDGETQVYGRRRYLGEDGKVYTATAEPAPKDGLVTHPIATTVQGQPALVAENGPEIVIGRETTKAIMMNEPELIKYLANYQQHGGSQGYSTARGLAAYDSGNVQSAAATQPSDISPQTSDPAAERQALINRLDRSDALMEQVLYFLQNPIAPEIAMYDTGGKKGLRSKMKEADRFMARYDG